MPPKGQTVDEDTRQRMAEARRRYWAARRGVPLPAKPDPPPKLCECGCGNQTAIAKRTNIAKDGYRQLVGERQRYAKGHGSKTYKAHIGGLSFREDGRWYVIGRNGTSEYWARIVMRNGLGRDLAPKEQVHHINGDRTDDRIENLQVMTHAEHSRFHLTKRMAQQKASEGQQVLI